MEITNILKRTKEVLGKYDILELRTQGFLPSGGSYAPCIHYPPLQNYPPIKEKEFFEGYALPGDNPLGIYVHFPFCIQQCIFCHFAVHVSASDKEKSNYLDYLEKEIDLFREKFALSKIPVQSILVGGGTPTHLSVAQLKRFLEFFTARLDLSRCTQFSYDVDPSTLIGKDGLERLKIMRDFGVDRLAIGVQALDDRILKKMNRAHNRKDVLQAIEQAYQTGFQDICVEFIYGYPDLSLQDWAKNLQEAIDLDVEEIQLYRLKILPYGSSQGKIFQDYLKGVKSFPTEDEALLMKEFSILALKESGYSENLTRVFTKAKENTSHYARDMCCYLRETVGFGTTSFSSHRDRFCRKERVLRDYYDAIGRGELPIEDGKIRTLDDQLRWALVLPLKNWEVNKKIFQKATGRSLSTLFRKKVEKLVKYDLLYEDDTVLRLTEKGRFFADQVCQQFYHQEHKPFKKEEYAPGELSPHVDTEY